MSSDPSYVAELETQVRLLGDRIIKVNEENEQKQAQINQLMYSAGRNPAIEIKLTEKVQQVQSLTKKLAAESKRRVSAERKVVALERELERKESLLERHYAEADLSERLSKVEPLLGTLHEVVLSLSLGSNEISRPREHEPQNDEADTE